MFTQMKLRECFDLKRKHILTGSPCSVFALAMPRFVGPSCWMYDIESALDRSVVGLAVGAQLRREDIQCKPDTELFTILVAAGVHEFSVHVTGFTGNELLCVRNKNESEVLWRRWDSGLTFTAIRVDQTIGNLTLNKLANSATWISDGSRSIRADFTTGTSRSFGATMRRLFRIHNRTEFKNDDVLFDDRSNYGVPGWAIGGVLLGIRMMLVPVDFE